MVSSSRVLPLAVARRSAARLAAASSASSMHYIRRFRPVGRPVSTRPQAASASSAVGDISTVSRYNGATSRGAATRCVLRGLVSHSE
eukprot:6192266-Pleurochrysis_carterae.AAC.1